VRLLKKTIRFYHLVVISVLFCFFCEFFFCYFFSSTGEDEAASFLVFDALRDTIYSEVATLIKENENRPHFLVSRLLCQ